VGQGKAVRIFTGGPVPEGADAIVIQENANAEGGAVTVRVEAPAGCYVRPAGLDFREGEVGLAAGRVLTARDIGLAAAMNVPWLSVRRRPRVALLATGDEIVRPGDPVAANQIVSSNALALAALVTANGAEAHDLGIARDTRESLQAASTRAEGADLFITIGGASVGDHDLIQSALGETGLAIDFWRIAMRPGKPLIFGRFRETAMLGLPGNPVSSLVCGLVFVVPAVRALLGLSTEGPGVEAAVLGCDVAENDEREDYLRAAYSRNSAGPPCATPYEKQDSSMLSVLTMAECLVVRPPHAPAARAGAAVEVIPFRRGPTGF
jgi:molybdopterin molybdotransferase